MKTKTLMKLAVVLLLGILASAVLLYSELVGVEESVQEVKVSVEANTAAMREIEQGRRQPTVLHSYADECDDLGGSQVYVPFQSLRACDATPPSYTEWKAANPSGSYSEWQDDTVGRSNQSFSIPHDRDWNDEFSEAYNWSPDN